MVLVIHSENLWVKWGSMILQTMGVPVMRIKISSWDGTCLCTYGIESRKCHPNTCPSWDPSSPRTYLPCWRHTFLLVYNSNWNRSRAPAPPQQSKPVVPEDCLNQEFRRLPVTRDSIVCFPGSLLQSMSESSICLQGGTGSSQRQPGQLTPQINRWRETSART